MRRLISLTAFGLFAAAPLMVAGAGAQERISAPDARAQASRVALVVYEGVPGAAAILDGNYQEGLDRSLAAVERAPTRRAMELATNICAARVKLGQLDAANISCEAALADTPPAGSVMAPQKYLAVAHVNHGVVHMVQGDYEFAEAEFRRAKRMFPSLGVATSNLAFVQEPERKPRVEVGEAL